MTTHMAVRSATMMILLRYLDLRFGSEKSMSEKDQDLGAGLGCGLLLPVGSICPRLAARGHWLR